MSNTIIKRNPSQNKKYSSNSSTLNPQTNTPPYKYNRQNFNRRNQIYQYPNPPPHTLRWEIEQIKRQQMRDLNKIRNDMNKKNKKILIQQNIKPSSNKSNEIEKQNKKQIQTYINSNQKYKEQQYKQEQSEDNIQFIYIVHSKEPLTNQQLLNKFDQLEVEGYIKNKDKKIQFDNKKLRQKGMQNLSETQLKTNQIKQQQIKKKQDYKKIANNKKQLDYQSNTLQIPKQINNKLYMNSPIFDQYKSFKQNQSKYNFNNNQTIGYPKTEINSSVQKQFLQDQIKIRQRSYNPKNKQNSDRFQKSTQISQIKQRKYSQKYKNFQCQTEQVVNNPQKKQSQKKKKKKQIINISIQLPKSYNLQKKEQKKIYKISEQIKKKQNPKNNQTLKSSYIKNSQDNNNDQFIQQLMQKKHNHKKINNLSNNQKNNNLNNNYERSKNEQSISLQKKKNVQIQLNQQQKDEELLTNLKTANTRGSKLLERIKNYKTKSIKKNNL